MPTASSAFVVGKEHHGHHDCDDDSQNYRDAHEDQQWRCCALTFLDHGFETLYLGDRMVYESTRLFPDLLQEEIRALPVIRRCAHFHTTLERRPEVHVRLRDLAVLDDEELMCFAPV